VNLIKILIVNFHYDLIMPNTSCTVILKKKEGYMNMYGHILYIMYILMSPELLRALTTLFLFSVLVS